jgi:hypothetical protein
VIKSLTFTILIEGIIVSGYSLWQKKPLARILLASVIVNFLTQSMLWGVLNLFPDHYLITLFTAEVFIWLIESVFLVFFPGTQLDWREASLLSFGMNMASFGIGWFLPI